MAASRRAAARPAPTRTEVVFTFRTIWAQRPAVLYETDTPAPRTAAGRDRAGEIRIRKPDPANLLADRPVDRRQPCAPTRWMRMRTHGPGLPSRRHPWRLSCARTILPALSRTRAVTSSLAVTSTSDRLRTTPDFIDKQCRRRLERSAGQLRTGRTPPRPASILRPGPRRPGTCRPVRDPRARARCPTTPAP